IMAKERQKAQETSAAQRLPAAALPDETRRWRRLARIRNRLMGVWLGGLTCEVALMLLGCLLPIPAKHYGDQILGLLCSLTVCWFGSGRALSLYERTVRCKAIARLGCWSDFLFPPKQPARLPDNGTEEYKSVYTEARKALLEQLPRLQAETASLLSME